MDAYFKDGLPRMNDNRAFTDYRSNVITEHNTQRELGVSNLGYRQAIKKGGVGMMDAHYANIHKQTHGTSHNPFLQSSYASCPTIQAHEIRRYNSDPRARQPQHIDGADRLYHTNRV